MAGPDSPSEVAERPVTPDVSPEVQQPSVSDSVVQESTAQPGDGAATFAQIATDSQRMASDGRLPNTSVNFNGEAGRQEQIDRLRTRSGAFAINSGIKPENRDAFLTSVVDTANALANQPSGSAETQQIFSKAVEEFQKNNPGVDATTFTRVMGSAFQDMGSHLSTRYTNNSVMLRDTNAISDKNPGGFVGVAFSGDTSTPKGRREKAAFDTAHQLANSNTPVDLSSPAMRELQGSNFLAGVPDMPPRSRPDNPQSAHDQMSQMRSLFGDTSDAVLKDVLKNADNLAFDTSGSQFSDRFSAAIDSLSAANPNLDKSQLTRMMGGALNTVTQSKDFSTSVVGSTYDMAFLKDARLKTDANPYGTVGAVLVGTMGNENLSSATADFNDSMQAARQIQQGVAKLGSDAKKEDVRQFLSNTKSDLANLKFTLF